MNIWNNIKRFFTNEDKGSNVTYSQDVLNAFGVGDGKTMSPENAMRVATVYACVDKLAGSLSTTPLKIYETDGESRNEMPRNNLWYLLNESPYIDFSAASAWENVSISNSLRGDAYWWIRRKPNGQIKDLFPLPWSTVHPQRMTDGTVRYYIWYEQFGIKTWIEQTDILHFPGLGFDGLRSMSVIKYAARNATSNALAMDDYSGKFFEGGAHPSAIIKYPKKMSAEQVKELQQMFIAKYSGSENFRKMPLILTEGGDVQEFSISAEDAQLLEARKFQVIDIARAFGVPPHMIGETSATTSWGSGIETLNRGFFTYTLHAKLVRIEQELNRKLFPRNSSIRIEFDREAILEGDLSAQAAYYRAALGGPGTGIGWLKADEIRRKKNLSPLGGIAGELYNPYQNSKGNEDGNEQQTDDNLESGKDKDKEPEKGANGDKE